MFPGLVMTPYINRMTGVIGFIHRTILRILAPFVAIPVEEVAERCLWLGTSGRFRAKMEGKGVLVKGEDVAIGTDGEEGSGVYSITERGDSSGENIVKVLKGYREQGMWQRIWEHTEGEFKRITGVA